MSAHLTALARQNDDIRLSWSDGLESVLEVRALRISCPCAFCVNELTGQRMLDPDSVPEEIALKDMQPVGNYAYRLLFDDGHHTGLFTVDDLRARCKEAVV
ncbi:MAG: DUF971 domain-containing protein [Planctomycetota bacterium]|jgi:DUF971 family protein|nr:DUF971 domain-containing protein [Planctomycetota bacterium]